MLLFFILFIQNAKATDCKPTISHITLHNIEIRSCNKKINKDIKYAVNFWKNKGFNNFSFNENKSWDCTGKDFYEKEILYIKVDESKASQKDSNFFVNGAITDLHIYSKTKKFHSGVTYIKDSYNNSKKNLLISHELGHVLGFDHVDTNECTGYVMNKTTKGMGSKF